ncbi:lipid-A-disaccharide synthase [Candidatus Poribacteria bacterium]|nr:lipid-A-disaccharide synthase [Candidatus Poribacteria bacterium]
MDTNIMMVAGEPSGDVHCSRLAAKLLELRPDANIFGMGGSLMSQAGVRLIYDISDSAVMGITEVLGKIPLMFSRLRGLKQAMDNQKPDILVLVDFGEFNIHLLSYAYQNKIPILYYIPPKAWAWRAKRGRKIARYASVVASIFPFEADFYRNIGARVKYVGHPILDFARPSMTEEESLRKFSLDGNKPIIGLMPGSRIKEINSLLPVITESAKQIKAEIPDCQFILPVAHTINHDLLPEFGSLISKVPGTRVYDVMNICDLMILASGTASLEAAYMMTPMIVIYKVSTISWIIMSTLVRNLKSSALPNIIADKLIVPELLQDKAEPENISEIALSILKNPNRLKAQKSQLQKIRKKLGNPGAVKRTAEIALCLADRNFSPTKKLP